MPDERDDDLVPPPKVMRKRLNGVYRADSGFSGPTRRYVLIVALLVGLASIPTLAAITAGSSELSNGTTHTMDVPFLPPASPGPIRTRHPDVVPGSGSIGPSPSPSGSVSPSTDPSGDPLSTLPPAAQGASRGAEAVIRAGRIVGRAGRRTARPQPITPDRDEQTSGVRQSSGDQPAKSGHPGGAHSGSKHPVASVPVSSPTGSLSHAGLPVVPADDSEPGRGDPEPEQPADPDEPPAWVDRPVCQDRDECGARPSHHHRPDLGRRRECDRSAHRGRWWHHRSIHIDRSGDRSEHRRRSAVTERPQNVRPIRALERSYANGGYHGRGPILQGRNPESRIEDNQIANRSYHGSHRLAGQHHADRPTPAEQRSSRMGRHHADPQDPNFNR